MIGQKPGLAPSNRSGLIRCPGNTKNGGMACPHALPPARRVIVLPFPDVTAGGL